MANSHRKCKYKECGEFYRVADGLKDFCSEDHKIAWAIEAGRKLRVVKAKEEKQKHARQKRAFYESDIKTRKAAAIREFNTYIRERDKGLPCISCRKPVRPDDYDAGHYIPAGSNSLLRFDEVNTNGQCAFYCNHSRSGNQVEYRKGLVEKYGEAEVLRLESTSGTIKRTAEDYKKIEIEYKNKRLALVQRIAA
jgi:hypothetical protein